MVKKMMHVTLTITKWRDTGTEQSDDLKELRQMFSDFVSQDLNDVTKYVEYFDIEIVIPDRKAEIDHPHMSFLTGLVKNIVHNYEIGSELFAEEEDDDLHHIYANESHMILNLQGTKVEQVKAWIRCLHTDGGRESNVKPGAIRFERVIKND